MAAVLAAAVTAAAQPPSVILLTGDEFSADEVRPDAPGTWFGLYVTEDASSVRPVEVAVREIPSPCLDETPAGRSGRAVSAGDPAPLLLMRRVPNLVPGDLSLVARLSPASGDRVEGRFGGRPIAVRSSPLSDGFRLDLDYDGQTRVLFATDWQDEGWWRVDWIGDLNGDQLPDVILRATHKYSVHVVRLFLSQRPAPGIAEVATFIHTAC
jgi:hypothetical protein